VKGYVQCAAHLAPGNDWESEGSGAMVNALKPAAVTPWTLEPAVNMVAQSSTMLVCEFDKEGVSREIVIKDDAK